MSDSQSPSKAGQLFASTRTLLTRFFASYLWLGFTLLLVSIIVSQSVPTPHHIATRVAIDLLAAIGTAILVAAIFSFAAGTTDFIARISEILQSIVVNRRFLNNMDEDAKKDVLRAILRPTDQQRDIYGNIESYYNYYINRSMRVARTSVRSNYVSSCYVFYSPDEQRLICEYTNNYRVYPSPSGFDDVTVGFHGEDGTCVNYESVSLFFPDGTSKRFSKEDLRQIPPTRLGGGDEEIRVPVSEIATGYSHIDVEFRVLQRGHDHWIQIGFQALQPTDGFRFTIHCEEPLVIQEEQTFIYGAKRIKDPPNICGCGRATISCQQWIDQGSGATAIIAAPHTLADSIHKDLASRSHKKREETLPEKWRTLKAETPTTGKDNAVDDSPSPE